MRLFRQSRRGDWDGVFAAIHEALAPLAQERGFSRRPGQLPER
jgi:hypothetical protein